MTRPKQAVKWRLQGHRRSGDWSTIWHLSRDGGITTECGRKPVEGQYLQLRQLPDLMECSICKLRLR